MNIIFIAGWVLVNFLAKTYYSYCLAKQPKFSPSLDAMLG